jgi:hypothetical protein
MASPKPATRPRTSLDPAEIRMIILTLEHHRGADAPLPGDRQVTRRLGNPDTLGPFLEGQISFKDRRLEAVHDFSLEILRTRGRPSVAALRGFLAAGFNRTDVLEVIRTVTAQTLARTASEHPLPGAPASAPAVRHPAMTASRGSPPGGGSPARQVWRRAISSTQPSILGTGNGPVRRPS